MNSLNPTAPSLLVTTGKIVGCAISIAVVTTMAALFFTHIIPLNSPVASLGCGIGFASFNVFPLGCALYLICFKKPPSQEKKTTTPPPIASSDSNNSITSTTVEDLNAIFDYIYVSSSTMTTCGNVKAIRVLFTVDFSEYKPDKSGNDFNFTPLYEAIDQAISAIHKRFGKHFLFNIKFEKMNHLLSGNEMDLNNYYNLYKKLKFDHPFIISVVEAGCTWSKRLESTLLSLQDQMPNSDIDLQQKLISLNAKSTNFEKSSQSLFTALASTERISKTENVSNPSDQAVQGVIAKMSLCSMTALLKSQIQD